MKKVIINEMQRGFLFKNGKYVKMLNPGKYYEYGDRSIQKADIRTPIALGLVSLNTLLADENVKKSVTVVEVADQEIALHYVNGKFDYVLTKGEYAYWNVNDKHDFKIIDISTPEVDASVPEYVFSKISVDFYTKIEVAEYQKARLYFNQKFIKVLDAGTYYFWKNGTKIDVGFVDTRLTQMDIAGQEILTQDKVSLRINFVCNYRVTVYVRILTEIDDFSEQIHVCAQLALREYVGKYKFR